MAELMETLIFTGIGLAFAVCIICTLSFVFQEAMPDFYKKHRIVERGTTVMLAAMGIVLVIFLTAATVKIYSSQQQQQQQHQKAQRN